MSMTTNPDIFINVHKGIRSALFKACTALGRAGDDADRDAAARILLRDALHFALLASQSSARRRLISE